MFRLSDQVIYMLNVSFEPNVASSLHLSISTFCINRVVPRIRILLSARTKTSAKTYVPNSRQTRRILTAAHVAIGRVARATCGLVATLQQSHATEPHRMRHPNKHIRRKTSHAIRAIYTLCTIHLHACSSCERSVPIIQLI